MRLLRQIAAAYRQVIALYLLDAAFYVMPDGPDKLRYYQALQYYFNDILKDLRSSGQVYRKGV